VRMHVLCHAHHLFLNARIMDGAHCSMRAVAAFELFGHGDGQRVICHHQSTQIRAHKSLSQQALCNMQLFKKFKNDPTKHPAQWHCRACTLQFVRLWPTEQQNPMHRIASSS
jgi:hypothetical protein